LAGQLGFINAFIDDMLDTDIKSSRYAYVVIKRIKQAYSNRFIFENPKLKWVWSGKSA